MHTTRQLSDDERNAAREILQNIHEQLDNASSGDHDLLWAIRRYIYKQLMYDERGNPMVRKKLKELKWKTQKGLCALCGKELPVKGAELDRIITQKGYAEENIRLIHHDCHIEQQERKGYT